MSNGVKVPYQDALATALHLQDALTPYCERVLVAGSLRRGRKMIGDVEIVVIPRTRSLEDMFGSVVGVESDLDAGLHAIAGILMSKQLGHKNGAKYKSFLYAPLGGVSMGVDLFIATADNWGYIATLRTGSAEFSKWLVTERKHGGAKPGGIKLQDGAVIGYDGKQIPTPEEDDFFRAIDLRTVPLDSRNGEPDPEERRHWFL